MSGYLTEDEAAAVRAAGELYTLLAQRVVGDGPTRHDDLAELRAHIHAIQHSIMAQAAARAHPQQFRLLGQVLSGGAQRWRACLAPLETSAADGRTISQGLVLRVVKGAPLTARFNDQPVVVGEVTGAHVDHIAVWAEGTLWGSAPPGVVQGMQARVLRPEMELANLRNEGLTTLAGELRAVHAGTQPLWDACQFEMHPGAGGG